jgi:hypothetical protein
MSRKKRKPASRSGAAAGPATAPTTAMQRGAQAMFFIAMAFVAAHEGIVGLGGPARTFALWALAAGGSLVGLARRRDARITDDLCLLLSPRARGGVILGILACVAFAFAGVGNREHGLFGSSIADAALVGCLVFASAMLAWGGVASAVRTLLGLSLPAILAGAIFFTMAFFTSSISSDVAVFVASLAGAIASQRTRSVSFAAIVFAYGVGGVPGAIATSALYVAIGAARL